MLGEHSPSTRGRCSPCLVFGDDLNQRGIVSLEALMLEESDSNSLDTAAAPGMLDEALGST